MRDEVNRALEAARKDKTIGNSLRRAASRCARAARTRRAARAVRRRAADAVHRVGGRRSKRATGDADDGSSEIAVDARRRREVRALLALRAVGVGRAADTPGSATAACDALARVGGADGQVTSE